MAAKFQYDFHLNHEIKLPKTKYTRNGLSGLVNLGNTCFMNSIIQCLSNTIKMTDYFISSSYLEDDPRRANKRRPQYAFLNSYVNLLDNMWDSNQLIKPRSFTEQLGKYVPKYSKGEQQDAHEFLMYTLDLLHESMKYSIEVEIKGEPESKADEMMLASLQTWKLHYENSYSKLVELFGGMVVNTFKCNNSDSCKHTSDVFEPFNCVSVDVPSTSCTLKSCLDGYFGEKSSIDTWACDSCKGVGCSKETKVWNLPNYLIIHLKRFDNSGKKIDIPVDFPLDNLDLTEYVSSDKNDPNNYIYSLYAVNCHMGSSNSGHYASACKNLDGSWYLFNDGNVSKHYNTEVFKKDAYILFFHRKFIKKSETTP
jgi:ubiquitin C-terminal hydrolase